MKQEATGETFPASPQATGGKTDWARVRAMKDANIQHDAVSPRTHPFDWANAVIKRAGAVIGTVRRRGPNKRAAKVFTTLRLPADTLTRWKSTGPGWQTRMAEVLTHALQ